MVDEYVCKLNLEYGVKFYARSNSQLFFEARLHSDVHHHADTIELHNIRVSPLRFVQCLIMSTTRLRSSDDKHGRFMQWAKERGVEINGVKPQVIPGRGLGLVTTRALQDGDRLLFIPERAMFKPDRELLKREGLSQASPQAQLAVSAMHAFGPPDSSLRVWIDTWPALDDFKQSMPMCWTRDVQQMLPPSVEQPLKRQLEDWYLDRNATRDICSKSGWSEDDFLYYWLIVNSRSFHWKPPHYGAGEMVMCPFIDYINHGPSGTTCRVKQTAKGYEVVADRNYGKLDLISLSLSR